MTSLRDAPAVSPKLEKFLRDQRPTTPFVVVDLDVVAQRYAQLIEALPKAQVLYAVKANPAPQVLDHVYAAGIRHFDTASLPEIELIRGRFPDAHCHFMAPVRIAGAARIALGDGARLVGHFSASMKRRASTGYACSARTYARPRSPITRRNCESASVPSTRATISRAEKGLIM